MQINIPEPAIVTTAQTTNTGTTTSTTTTAAITKPPMCPNAFKITSSTLTQIKSTVLYNAKKTEKNWAITLVFDQSVKSLKVLDIFVVCYC